MTAVLIGLALALAAAVSQSGGFLCQHLSADRRPPVTVRRPIRTLRAMLSSGWWRIGLLLAGLGFALHLSALALAPISLVQAFVAGGLALAVPLAARVFRHDLTTAERRAVLVMAACLAALALGIPDPTRHLHFDASALWVYLVVLALLGGLLAGAVQGPLRHPALGLAAGLFYAVLDSSTKGLTDIARADGVTAVLSSPFLIAAAAGAIAAFFCFQRALQTNRPLTAIAVMEAGATTGGVMAGFVAFGDSLGATPAIGALHLAAFIGVGIAAWSLAPAQARLAASTPPDVAGAGTAGGVGVEPAPRIAQGDGHLGAPEPPVVHTGGLGGAHSDSQPA
jgi:multidrug transporter EmrE-like cation transporter